MVETIIGQGERLAVRILSKLYPELPLRTQVPLSALLSRELREDMGSRAKKETLDIVLYRPKPLIIRIQDDRHKTKNFGIIDNRQKTELELSGCDVLDIWKADCPHLFSGKNKDKAELEIKKILSYL